MSADNSHGRRRGSQSGEKSTNFIDGFVINHLLQHSERKNLAEFETKDGRYLLRFTDVEKVSNCYWEYKLKHGKVLKREPQKKRDNFKNSMAQFQQKGLLKKVGSGNELEKEFVTYEIYDKVLWRSLKRNPRSSHEIQENFGADNVGASLPTSGLETSDTVECQRDINEERTGSWSSIYTNASGEDTHLGMALSDDPLYPVILSPNLPANETRREILPSEISSDAQDFSQSDDLRGDKAHRDIGANACKTSSDTGLDATQSDEQLCNQGECSFKATAASNDWLVRPSDHSTSEASGLENIPAGSGPKATKNEIWFDFVCAYLAKDVQGRKLVKLVRKDARCFVLFSDIGKLSLFYRDFKRQNGGQDLKGDVDSRKKILKNLLAPSTEEKLVKISASGEDFELKKEFIKYEILDKDLRGALSRKYSVRKKRDMKCEDSDTSTDTGLGVSEDPSFKDLGFSFSNKMALHDKYLHENEAVNQMDPLQVEITPNASSVEVEWSFNINANQDLPEAYYFIQFGEYGTCLALGDGHKCLQGKENIPKPTRTETHEVQVTVIDESCREIGHCLFTYIGTNSNANKQKVPSEDQSSFDRLGTLNRQQQATKKSSSGPMGNVVPSKRSRPSDMSLLMYLCDKMARRGDEDFFRALVKLGILADVLANCSNYSKSCAVTAQEHGHGKLAELIVMSRNPSCDNLMEKLTLEKLVDAVRVERSLVNSIYSSDDVSDSTLNGYDGDSEDDKLSSSADSDDDDPCICIIPQERETDYQKVELESLELAESYEILEVESKRVPSPINVPMVRAQFESSGVGTLNFNATRRLDDMDVQAVRPAVVETTSFPTSVDHSTNLKIGHDCDLPGTGTSKLADSQTRYKTDLNEEKGSANCGITQQGIQVQDINVKGNYFFLNSEPFPVIEIRPSRVFGFSAAIARLEEWLQIDHDEFSAAIARVEGWRRRNGDEWPGQTDDEWRKEHDEWCRLSDESKRNQMLGWERKLKGLPIHPRIIEQLNRRDKYELIMTFLRSFLATITASNEMKRERKRQLQLEWKRNQTLLIEMFGSVNVLGQSNSRCGRLKVRLMSLGSGCGPSLWQQFIKRRKIARNTSLTYWFKENETCPLPAQHLDAFLVDITGFPDPCINAGLLSNESFFTDAQLNWIDQVCITCSNTVSIGPEGLTVFLGSSKHLPLSDHVSLGDEGNNPSEENKQIEKFVDICKDTVDEEQSTGAKNVKRIALALVGSGDELAAIKVEFISEARLFKKM